MMKRFLGCFFVFSLILSVCQCSVVLAEGAKDSLSSAGVAYKSQNVYGVVGNVEYTEFKSRGESAIVIKNKKGESVKVSLKQVEPGSIILATYRKENDKKGKEKNVLISLSIVKPAQDAKTARRKR